MAIVRGILQEISAGTVIPVGTGRFTARESWGGTGPLIVREGKNTLGGWTRHAFLEVGGTRIPQVLVRPIHEQLLQSALGEEVALSLSRFGATHRVEVLSTPKDGVIKPSLGLMFMGLIYKLVNLLVALVGVVFFGAIVWGVLIVVVGHFVDHKTLLTVVALASLGLLALWLVWGNLSGIFKTWVAWGAL